MMTDTVNDKILHLTTRVETNLTRRSEGTITILWITTKYVHLVVQVSVNITTVQFSETTKSLIQKVQTFNLCTVNYT